MLRRSFRNFSIKCRAASYILRTSHHRPNSSHRYHKGIVPNAASHVNALTSPSTDRSEVTFPEVKTPSDQPKDAYGADKLMKNFVQAM